MQKIGTMKHQILNKSLSLACILCLSFSLFAKKGDASPGSVDTDDLKPRIVVLTDIAPGDTEPDDMESMIRLLSHADLFEIEVIITCSGWNSGGAPYSDEWAKYLDQVIDAYNKDLPNLMKRSEQKAHVPVEMEAKTQKIGYWPSAEYLRNRHFFGSRHLGVDRLGIDNISAGSNEIIRLAEEADDRPLWILVWGGGNTVAQALWQLKEANDNDRLDKVLEKIRIYTITDQDVDWMQRGQYDLSSHKWMRNTFGDKLFFIWDESAWLSQNETGANNWKEYEAKIQNMGEMGKIYPKYKYGVEGDTPSFLYVLPNGLHDPDMPMQGSWGGYFRKELSPDSVTVCYTNMRDDIKDISRKYEEYFYPAIFNNFAARMEWAATGKGNHNPEIIVNGQGGYSPIIINAVSGEKIKLDISKTKDPDGDRISNKLWIMEEAADTLPTDCLGTDRKGNPIIAIPENYGGKEIHLIFEVTDSGSIPLTSYRRIILRIS